MCLALAASWSWIPHILKAVRHLHCSIYDCLIHSNVQWRFIAADGVEMPLEEGTSAFITMNPGYIGRAELPESLKALFRPITVVVPDRQLIMENMLMAEGFETAKVCLK